MTKIKHSIEGKVWIYDGPSPWHFVTIDKTDVLEIKKEVFVLRGFRSIPVMIVLGKTKWKTSIFPDKNGCYVLPLKKVVRDKEGVNSGDKIKFILEAL